MLAAFLVTAVQSSAFAAWKNLQIVNHTNFDLKGVYISSSGRDTWGSNLLDATLKNGGSTTISYDDGFRYYDLKIVFMNDAHREWTGDQRLDFKNAWRMTIYNSGKTEPNNNRMIFTVSMN